MSYTARLVGGVKWPFLMACIKVFLARLNRAAWYNLDRYDLLLSARVERSDSCCLLSGWLGLLVRLTCRMPDVVGRFPSSTVSSSLTKLRSLEVYSSMQPSFQSCPIDMRGPDCRWGKMWAVRPYWFNWGFIFISSLWVACIMILSGRMTWGEFVIGCLLLHGVFVGI